MKVASAFFDSRLTGPAIPIAATTSPASLRIGAAMQRMPSSLSSSSIAQPRSPHAFEHLAQASADR